MKPILAPTPDTIADTLRKRLSEHEHRESCARLAWARTALLPAIRGLAPVDLRRVLVFGSSGRGSAGARSDIDVLVLAEGAREWDYYERLRWGMRVRAATDRRYAVDILLYTPAEAGDQDGLRGRFLDRAQREGVALLP
ncbi:nucleotidyltransferase domain-containing protein [Acidiferrobacter sp.]|uniref:nucleotidyltransferase family protein n=1 Tax=Acidiferrobacter sp. TaxID=1872107 RepID=UPI0026052813|nr:nucleotidyltransferase domain-containing protein [Acidiferrobacter sp.]